MRRALLLAMAAVATAAALVACGSGGGGTTTAVPDKAADAEVLDGVLARQMAAIKAYDHSLRALGGQALAAARLFRAQEQEHVDAILKALRGLGAKAEPTPETIDSGGLKTEAEYLVFLYEVESATIDTELSAISNLSDAWPRSLLASTVANQAQHLVLLRRALGAKPLETVPEPFENGTALAPQGMIAQ